MKSAKLGILELIVRRCVTVLKHHATYLLGNVQMMVAKRAGKVIHVIKVKKSFELVNLKFLKIPGVLTSIPKSCFDYITKGSLHFY